MEGRRSGTGFAEPAMPARSMNQAMRSHRFEPLGGPSRGPCPRSQARYSASSGTTSRAESFAWAWVRPPTHVRTPRQPRYRRRTRPRPRVLGVGVARIALAQPPPARFLRHRRHRMEHATDLERAHRLENLRLEQDRRITIGRPQRHERRIDNDLFDPISSGANLCKCGSLDVDPRASFVRS